jgi:hypothetical protein
MEIPVTELCVSVYIRAECPTHSADGWALRVQPVGECPCYLCLKNNDKALYDDYLQVISRRPEAVRDYPYEKFMELRDEMLGDGGYCPAKVPALPMWKFEGKNLLSDGHHRAAIILFHYPTAVLPVKMSPDKLPIDHNRRCNRCEP